jgi:hypothetical protein
VAVQLTGVSPLYADEHFGQFMGNLVKFIIYIVVSAAIVSAILSSFKPMSSLLRIVLFLIGLLVLIFLGGCFFSIQQFNSHL